MQKTRIVGLIGALLALVMCGDAWGKCQLSLKEIQSQITREGAKDALDDLFDDKSGKWDRLMECIATGEKPWLEIDAELKPYSDAGSAEDLDIFAGKALANNAENVLRVGVGACAMVENDAPEGMDQVQADKWYITDLKARLAGLSHVHSPDLTYQVTTCRDEIQDGIKYLKADIDSQGKGGGSS